MGINPPSYTSPRHHVTAVEHVVAEGPQDAPAVVLAGSLGSTLAMWDEQVQALSERFGCCAETPGAPPLAGARWAGLPGRSGG